MSDKVASWFNDLSEQQNKLLQELRSLILSQCKNCREEFKWGRPCYSINHLVCYLHKSAQHVTIGFYQGAHLNDPQQLLQGEGKDMRHIKIKLGDTINKRGIKQLVKNAIEFEAR